MVTRSFYYTAAGIPGYNPPYQFWSKNFYKTGIFGLITFIITGITTVLGMSKFFLASRLRLVPEISIFSLLGILILNTGSMIRSFYIFIIFPTQDEPSVNQIIFQTVFGIPPFVIQLILLFATAGMKRTLRLVTEFPQIVLSAAFTPFMFYSRNICDYKFQCACSVGCKLRYDVLLPCNLKQACENSCNKKVKNPNQFGIQMCRSGSFLNAIYIILFPACLPIFQGLHTDICKHLWPMVGKEWWTDESCNFFKNVKLPLLIFPVVISYAFLAIVVFYGMNIFCCVHCKQKNYICGTKVCSWPCLSPQSPNQDIWTDTHNGKDKENDGYSIAEIKSKQGLKTSRRRDFIVYRSIIIHDNKV
jgi:hypothetical protein